MFDLSPCARPGEKLDLEEDIEVLREAGIALDAIGKKLEMMCKIAAFAADPKCDPVKRIELNLLFRQLEREIDDRADASCGGIQLLNNMAEKLSPS